MNISTQFRIASIITVFIFSLIGFSANQILECEKQQRIDLENKEQLEALGRKLAYGSDYLTKEIRAYVQLGDKTHFDNFWKEVNETKNREIASDLVRLNVLPVELDFIKKSKIYSDKLIKTEEQAMEAVEEGSFDEARNLVFGEYYSQQKDLIMGNIKKFREAVSNRTDEKLKKAQQSTSFYMYLTNVLIGICGFFVLMCFYKLKKTQEKSLVSERLAGIGELVAGVSHEVLNPVNIISVHTQMLQLKTLGDPETQKFCSKLRHEIDRITKIMGSLLEFSRNGNSNFEKKLIKEEMDKVIELVKENFNLENIEIINEHIVDSVEVLYDSDKMRQVFLNLINNAKHAMPNGGTLTIGYSRTNMPGKKSFLVKVSDTGHGMSEKVRSKVFDPFFTTKPEGEGTGMGLSVAHGIVQEHGGELYVESEEGTGTTFIISLPVPD